MVTRPNKSVPNRLLGEEVRVYWDKHRPAHKPARQQAYQEKLLTKAEHIGEQA